MLLMLQLSDSQLLFVLRRFASLVFSLLPNILTLYHIPLVLLYPKYPKNLLLLLKSILLVDFCHYFLYVKHRFFFKPIVATIPIYIFP